MAVLKQTSPTAWPVAPKPTPSSTVPSARTSSAVGFGSLQLSRAGSAIAGCFSVIERLNLEAAPRVELPWEHDSTGCDFAKGHSRAARRDQHRLEGRDEGPRRAPRVDAAPGQ